MGPCYKLGSGKSPGPNCRNVGPVTGKSSSWACLVLRCEGLRHVCGAHASSIEENWPICTVIHKVRVTNRTGLILHDPKLFGLFDWASVFFLGPIDGLT
ncbi:unnamed protein product [Trifolium pratense]|uniref:Uncharacterized protein n=1 Tax=Trifolium pratense TaxID=57577 RepID=A0ACB0KVF7_TRIPR|nr:unnamed protein product [Trifolium pratense]